MRHPLLIEVLPCGMPPRERCVYAACPLAKSRFMRHRPLETARHAASKRRFRGHSAGTAPPSNRAKSLNPKVGGALQVTCDAAGDRVLEPETCRLSAPCAARTPLRATVRLPLLLPTVRRTSPLCSRTTCGRHSRIRWCGPSHPTRSARKLPVGLKARPDPQPRTRRVAIGLSPVVAAA